MKPAPLLTTLLLAIAVSANSFDARRLLMKAQISKHFNITSAQDVLRRNQDRAKALRAKDEPGTALYGGDGISAPIVNRAATFYTASVGVGSPPTFYNLVVQSTSGNTWIGANKPYVQTSTSIKTDNTMVKAFSGPEYIDQVTLATGLVIPQQSIGVVDLTDNGIDDSTTRMDGILGIGPTDLTAGTLIPEGGLVPTITDNLFSDGTITNTLLSISFEPITDPSGTEMNGEITWGGTDSSKFTGEITYTPITTTYPSWGFDQSITYGDTTLVSGACGYVDTASPGIYFATDVYNAYKSATGSVVDSINGYLTVTSAQFANLQTLSFIISGKSFDLTPDAQIWPRNLNAMIGGTASGIYLIVGDLGDPKGDGFDLVIGLAFLERFYTVVDTANNRVGFATTPFTTATTN